MAKNIGEGSKPSDVTQLQIWNGVVPESAAYS